MSLTIHFVFMDTTTLTELFFFGVFLMRLVDFIGYLILYQDPHCVEKINMMQNVLFFVRRPPLMDEYVSEGRC